MITVLISPENATTLELRVHLRTSLDFAELGALHRRRGSPPKAVACFEFSESEMRLAIAEARLLGLRLLAGYLENDVARVRQ